MSYEDFMNNMDDVLMCHLSLDSLSSEVLDVTLKYLLNKHSLNYLSKKL